MISKTISNNIVLQRALSFPLPQALSRLWYHKGLLHVLFWLVFYLFNGLVEGSYFDNYIYAFYASLVRLPLQIGIVYFNVYYLLPRYFLTGKYNMYFMSLIVVLAGVVLIKRLLIYEVVYPATCPVSYEAEALITFSNFFLMLSSEVYLIGLTAAIKMSVDWAKNIQTTKTLEQEKLEAELGLLKAQIQPHFFFNTLNNLYALTLKKSEQAPGVVQKLSELMSYLLYDCDTELVALQDEVKLIHNYADLEKLRYGKRLQLSIDIRGAIHDRQIPPYIILPFVENAFKHGQAKLAPVHIHIVLAVEQEQLVLLVKNPVADMREKSLCTKGGIGLKNVQRRLELLYATNYSLEVQQESEAFSLSLRIPLNGGKSGF